MSWSHVKKAKTIKVLGAVPVRNAGDVTAYDGCFPKPKQFYFTDNHPLAPNRIYSHEVDSCHRSC